MIFIMMVYYNPRITGQFFHPLIYPKQPGCFLIALLYALVVEIISNSNNKFKHV